MRAVSLLAAQLASLLAHGGQVFPDYDCSAVQSTNADRDIDWLKWRRVFDLHPVKKWGDYSGAHLNTFMDGDAGDVERWREQCPLGVLQAVIMIYIFSVFQDDTDGAMMYAELARQHLAEYDLRVLIGSRWPTIAMLTSEKLRDSESVRSISDDPSLNCDNIAEPLLNWQRFRGIFAAGGNRKDWFAESIRYVFSWQMEKIPEKLSEECPLGFLTATVIKAFVCATTESSCFAGHAGRVEAWLRNEKNAFLIIAHSRWPIAIVLNHMARATRHRFHLDFTEQELLGETGVIDRGFPQNLLAYGPWASKLVESGHSQSFRDMLSALPHLEKALPGAPTLVYITMVYGAQFNRHIRRFCARARALGVGGRLLLFTLDEEAFRECLVENGQRCIRGTPSIVNKFTLPLICAHFGLDSFWIDLDVFLMVDPTPALIAHAERGPYDILISGSFEADCICNGIVYFRATEVVRTWLLAVIVWMYHHPYEHDQKTFSAFLNYTETVSTHPLDLPEIPAWDTLDPINAFVTPDTYEGNGWTGELENIVIYHFLNGESDTGSDLDPSGTWMKEHGHFDDDIGAPNPQNSKVGGGSGQKRRQKITLMDLFYLQSDETLYTSPKPAHENPAIRRALLSSRKSTRRTDLLGKPCGPMVGVVEQYRRSAASAS